MKIPALLACLALAAWSLVPLGASAEASPSPVEAPSPVGASSPSPVAVPSPLDEAGLRVLELTNAARVGAGMLPLRWSPVLAEAALTHAADMAARGYFAHNSPEGTSPTERAARAGYGAYGWGGHYVGENLARGYAGSEEAFRGWMESPGHRANILNPLYREMGLALVTGPGGVKVWAQEFGSRPGEVGVFIDSDAPVASAPWVELSIGREEVSDWGSLGEPVAMMVSNRSDFSLASWEPYSPRKAWVLEGEGRVGVYVLLQDGAGRRVSTADDILLSGSRLAGGETLHREMAAQGPSALEEGAGDEEGQG